MLHVSLINARVRCRSLFRFRHLAVIFYFLEPLLFAGVSGVPPQPHSRLPFHVPIDSSAPMARLGSGCSWRFGL